MKTNLCKYKLLITVEFPFMMIFFNIELKAHTLNLKNLNKVRIYVKALVQYGSFEIEQSTTTLRICD